MTTRGSKNTPKPRNLGFRTKPSSYESYSDMYDKKPSDRATPHGRFAELETAREEMKTLLGKFFKMNTVRTILASPNPQPDLNVIAAFERERETFVDEHPAKSGPTMMPQILRHMMQTYQSTHPERDYKHNLNEALPRGFIVGMFRMVMKRVYKAYLTELRETIKPSAAEKEWKDLYQRIQQLSTAKYEALQAERPPRQRRARRTRRARPAAVAPE
jgi:hypothetical protein